MSRPARSTVLVVALATTSVACANVLGLDQGLPESTTAGDADLTDHPTPSGEDGDPSDTSPPIEAGAFESSATADASGRTDASAPADASAAADVNAPEDVSAPKDASPPADASGGDTSTVADAPACGNALAACQVAADCCSGVCTLGLTCL